MRVLGALGFALFVVLLLALVVGMRYLAAGGDWGCVMSQDPTICHAISTVTK